MKKLFLLLFSFIALSAMSQTEADVVKRLQDKYVQFLKEEGFVPSIDSDGDVSFKYEGDTYYIKPHGNQPLYFRITKYLNHEDGCSTKIREAVNHAASARMSVSAYISDDCTQVSITSGNYIANEDDFKYIFYSALKATKHAVQDLLDHYNN